jgi:hypothetical protein
MPWEASSRAMTRTFAVESSLASALIAIRRQGCRREGCPRVGSGHRNGSGARSRWCVLDVGRRELAGPGGELEQDAVGV